MNKNIEEDIHKYEVIKWRTFNSVFQDNFKFLIQQKKYEDKLTDDYISRVADRWREIQKVQIKLSLLLFSLIIFMGGVGSGVTQDILIFGIKMSNNNSALAILVLISSLLMFATSISSLLTDRYEGIVKVIASTRFDVDKNLNRYFTLQFNWDLSTVFDGNQSHDENLKGGGTVGLLMLLLFSCILFAFVIVVILQYYIFISSIALVYENPILPKFLNVPIVLLAICAVLFVLGSFIMRLPLPFSDWSTINALDELKKSEPERVEEIRVNIAKRSLKKERRNVLTLQMVIMLSCMIILNVIQNGWGFLSNYSNLLPLALASFSFIYFISPLLDKYEKWIILSSGKIEEKILRVQYYVKSKKRILIIRLLTSAIYGTILFFWFE